MAISNDPSAHVVAAAMPTTAEVGARRQLRRLLRAFTSNRKAVAGMSLLVVFVLLALLSAASALFVQRSGRSPLWVIVAYIVIFIVGFLTWAAAGATIPVTAAVRSRPLSAIVKPSTRNGIVFPIR